MNGLIPGLLAGLAFGTFSVLTMLPMKMEDKGTALASAFASRFAIGFLIPNMSMPLPLWAIGALTGFLVSLSGAIVTRAYAPILILGTLGGAVIGAVLAMLGSV